MYFNLPIKKISWLTFGSLLSILFGYVSFKCLPDIVVKQIQKRVNLSPSSPVYELWRDAPVDIYHKFYFFNITNPVEVEREGAKPILREIGPFVYNIKMKKVPVTDNGNDTVSYRELKQWFFNPELSAYNEDYVITTVNAPLISALNFIQRAPQPLRTWISITLDTISEGIFIRRSIKQLTFYGYPDILVSIGTLIDPRTPNTDGRFAYLAQKNNTAEVEYTLFSGIANQTKLGLIEKVEGRNYISKWKDYPCRSLKETYTGQMMYSPLESSRLDVQMFNDLFGRKINLKYKGTLDSYPGVKAYRYTFDPNNFKNAVDFPPNACYTSRLPKEMFDAQTNSTNGIPAPVERTGSGSPGSLLLNLARRRFESGASPLANLFNRNILSRPGIPNAPAQRPPVTVATLPPSTTTTTTTAASLPETNDEANEETGSEPTANDSEHNGSRNNPAESLVMTTEAPNTISRPAVISNAHSNAQPNTRPNAQPNTRPNPHPNTQPNPAHFQPPTAASQPASSLSRESADHPSDLNMPRDANLFTGARLPESRREDQFGSTLGALFSNRVRDSPLLSLFAPRDQPNGSPDARLSTNRLFNRNGNNVLGNLISNGLNRLLSLRNSRRLDENAAADRTESNNELSSSEPNRRTVLSRSVRNALRRVSRNTGPMPSHNRTMARITSQDDYIALRKQNMFPSGAFDFSEIAFGAPILLSQPHFLNADPFYADRIIGMRPRSDKHDFYIDVEPITGSSIRTEIRLQINVALLKSPNIFRFRNFKENIFPVFWQEIDMELPETYQSMLRMVGAAPNTVSEVVLCLCIIIAMTLFTSAVFVFAKAKTKTLSDSSSEFAGNASHRSSIAAGENVGALNGQPIDNKHLASNMAYSTNVNNNNNESLSSFNKHKSKESLSDEENNNNFSEQHRLHMPGRERLTGIDNPIPVLP